VGQGALFFTLAFFSFVCCRQTKLETEPREEVTERERQFVALRANFFCERVPSRLEPLQKQQQRNGVEGPRESVRSVADLKGGKEKDKRT
jgi:hypothetical protein